MSEIINKGWLTDESGTKFAPKTLLSQVQSSDGILLEVKIEEDINNLKNEIEIYTDTNKQDKISDTLILVDTVTGIQHKIQIQNGQLVNFPVE